MDKKDLVFVSEYNEKVAQLLIREAIKSTVEIVTIDSKSNLHTLSPSDLQMIYSNRPNRIHIYFRKPYSVSHRIQDFGDGKHIGMDDLLVDKKVVESLINSPIQENPVVKPLKITIQNRNAVWQETAKEVINENATWNKMSVAEEVFARLKKNNPTYVMKSDSLDYPVATIMRHINMGKSSRR